MGECVPLKEQAETVRAILSANLPWSPLDFIRKLSPTADRALYARTLTRPLPEADDLRFIYRAGDGGEYAVFAERLPWDSDFFGYGIARLNAVFPVSAPFAAPFADYTEALRALIKLTRDRGVVYLFALVEPRDLATLRALGQLGFSLIETRVFYHVDLQRYEHKERYRVRPATAEDVDSLSRAAREAINLYDRFHADPFVGPVAADRMMAKWVEASILESFADITIVPDVPKPAAFCTVKYHRDKWDAWGLKIAQPVFSAVTPEFRGWYRRIISEINIHLQEVGAEYAYLSTQFTNKAVIRVWESLGYFFGKGEHVFRITL